MKKMNRMLAVLLAFLLMFGGMVDTVASAASLGEETQPEPSVSAEPIPDVGGGA